MGSTMRLGLTTLFLTTLQSQELVDEPHCENNNSAHNTMPFAECWCSIQCSGCASLNEAKLGPQEHNVLKSRFSDPLTVTQRASSPYFSQQEAGSLCQLFRESRFGRTRVDDSDGFVGLLLLCLSVESLKLETKWGGDILGSERMCCACCCSR
jgi:hypothetical protein